VASAISSSSVKSLKYFSTRAALSVPAPASIKAAPSENKPFGIAIKPEPTPAKTD